MSKFNVGDRVKVVNYPDTDWGYLNQIGTVVRYKSYCEVKFNDNSIQLMKDSELELVTDNQDVVGKNINVGDVIVYFTRTGSYLYSQKARVESIGTKRSTGPHILVKREDAVEKDRFTRKAWLWSFDNSVKIS